jgi:Flp pilus assembly protein TadG
MRRLKRFVCDEKGQELVEFAFVAVWFFTFFFIIVGFCQVLYAVNFVETAANMGARYEMVRGADWEYACTAVGQLACKDTATQYVIPYIQNMPHPFLTAANITVTPNWMATAGDGTVCLQYQRGCQVQVTVSYTYSLFTPFLPALTHPISSTSIRTIHD